MALYMYILKVLVMYSCERQVVDHQRYICSLGCPIDSTVNILFQWSFGQVIGASGITAFRTAVVVAAFKTEPAEAS